MRGWEATERLLRDAASALGPFDGVLGFSQGASTAALALATIPELRNTRDVRRALLRVRAHGPAPRRRS
jgi:hypothetical protein